jgi:hypothetical protein
MEQELITCPEHLSKTLMEQELITRPEHLSITPILVGFVMLYL